MGGSFGVAWMQVHKKYSKGVGSVIYVYRKTIRIAPIMDSELDVCDEFAVDSDECDLDADPSGRVSGV